MPIAVAQCMTAEEVRANARAVVERRRRQESRLRADAMRRKMLVDAAFRPVPEPEPQPQPEPVTMTAAQLDAWIRSHEDKMRAVLRELDEERGLAELKQLPSANMIVLAICKAFRVPKNDLLSARRTMSIVTPRQIGMAITKALTLKSLPEIGRRFGGRDHTTVLYAVRKFEWLIERLRAELTSESPVELWAERAMQIYSDAAG